MNITYVQTEPDFIQTSETHENGSFTSGIIRRHEMRKDIEGELYSPWYAIDPAEVNWLDMDVYKQGLKDSQAAEDIAKAKQDGILIKGVGVSLNESNQNGIASVMAGATLANKKGVSIFPLNFNAETAQGVESVSFADLAEFEDFALEFVASRQSFFQ
jgi:hypothetical protein